MRNILILSLCFIFEWRPSIAQEVQTLPLYEFGLGLMGARFPTYPGSSESIGIAVPIPAMAYRGKIFRTVKEGGVKGRLFVSEDFEFDMSFDGNFSSNRYESVIREGMPSLGLLLEIGPRLTYFWSKDPKRGVELCFTIRKAFHAVWPDLNQNGYSISPYANFRVQGWNKLQGTLLLRLGAKWGSQVVMDYFYGVDEIYETADRPAFNASPGVLGYFFVANFYQPLPFTHTIYYIGHSENRDSPMLTESSTWTVALGLLYTFYKSDELIQVRNE